MVKLGNVVLGIDSFFVDTRIGVCLNRGCRFNMNRGSGLFCLFKEVTVDSDGRCGAFETNAPLHPAERKEQDENSD